MKNEATGHRHGESIEESSVRVDLARGQTAGADPQENFDEPGGFRRGGVALLVTLVAIVVFGAVLWSGRDETRSVTDEAAVEAPQTSAEDTAGEDSDSASSAVDVVVVGDTAPPPPGIHNIVSLTGRWFAMAEPQGGQLLTSFDGVEWGEVEDSGPGRLTALGKTDNDELIGVFQRRIEPTEDTADEVRIEVATLDLESLQWLTASQRASVQVPDSQSIAIEVHEGNVVALVQHPWKQPVAAVSEVLRELTDRAIADQTCALERNIGDGNVAYDLLDCGGELIGSVAAPGAVDDQLSFAQDVMQSRVVSYVSIAGAPFNQYEFEAATFPAALAVNDTGLVVAVLDARDTLQNPENFFATALESSLFTWDVTNDDLTAIEPPGTFSAWTSRLAALHGGQVAILGPTGGFSAEPPFVDWQKTWDMPDGASAVGIGMAVTLDGEGVKVIIEDGAALWIAYRQEPMHRVEAPAGVQIVDVLIVTPDRVAVLAHDGRVEWLEIEAA